MSGEYDIEFDREGIYRFRKWQWLWVGLIALGPLFAIFGMLSGIPDERNRIVYASTRAFVVALAVRACIGYAIGAAISVVVVALSVGRIARRYANGIKARVVGPYLNIIEDGFIYCDRKIHFNQITDYAVIQDFDLRRAGIFAIRMNLIGATGARNQIILPGVTNAVAVRDKLVALDLERERLPG